MMVGITGGIGTGKTTVAKIFASFGVPVYDADSATKKLMYTNKALMDKLVKHFGQETYKEGMLDRKYIAGIVFRDKNKLELLNSIVHPFSIADASVWAAKQIAPYVIKEAALLFETEAFHHVSYTIGVTAPIELRIERVMQRDQVSREEVIARMQMQISDTIKMKLCDFVIENNETRLMLPQVVHLHDTLLKLSKN